MRALLALAALLATAAAPAPPPPAAATTPPAEPGVTPEIIAAQRMARTANAAGQFGDAEVAFRRVLALQAVAKASDAMVGATLLDLSLNVSNQRRDDEAAALVRRAEPLLQGTADETLRARLGTYRALGAANDRDYAVAQRYIKGAIETWRRLADAEAAGQRTGEAERNKYATSPTAELGYALTVKAKIDLRAGDAISAYAAAGEAYLILDKADEAPRWWQADTLAVLGQISAAQGRFAAAETYLKAATKLNRELFGDTVRTAQSLAQLGAIYQQAGLNSAALASFHEVMATARAAQLPPGSLSAELVAPYLATILSASAEADATQRAQLQEEAFAALQLVQSPVIDRTVAQAAARLAAGDPPMAQAIAATQAAQLAQAQARIRLAWEQSLPDEERSAARETTLRADADAATAAATAAQQALAKSFPAYRQFSDPAAPTLAALRATLAPGEGVVTFLLARDTAYAQLVTRDTARLVPIAAGSDAIVAAVNGLRQPLETRAAALGSFDLSAAARLHALLLGGLEPDLSRAAQLTFVANDTLANLPFALLVTAPTRADDYAHAAWLVRRHAIAYTPSIPSLVRLRTTPPATLPTRPLLAFGDPALAGTRAISGLETLSTYCRVDGPIPARLLSQLPPLPDTERELRSVAGAQGNNLFLGAQATEPNLLRQNLADYRVLYFATHAVLPGELRCQSQPGLVLTPPAATPASANSDGLLDASEIAGLKLNADLVVLSACNTAAQTTGGGGGEALSGLAEAFFHAGARNLLVSHWAVSSRATAQLMTDVFRDERQAGGNVALALQRAQLAMLAKPDTAHPFFWAAFVVLGEGDAARAASPAGAAQ